MEGLDPGLLQFLMSGGIDPNMFNNQLAGFLGGFQPGTGGGGGATPQGNKINWSQLGGFMYNMGKELWKMGKPQDRASIPEGGPPVDAMSSIAAKRGIANNVNQQPQQPAQPSALTDISPMINAVGNLGNPLTSFSMAYPGGGDITVKGGYNPAALGGAMGTGGKGNSNFPQALQLP